MPMKTFDLEVRTRTQIGGGPSRRLRQADEIPAVLYGKFGSRSIRIAGPTFRSLFRQVEGAGVLIEIKEEGQEPVLSLIKEVQRNTRSDAILHVDFFEIERGKPMTASVSVHLVGEAVGVRTEGGVLEISAHEMTVRCLPRNLPESIEIDVTDLHVENTIQMHQVPPIAEVEFLDPADKVIVRCSGQAPEEEEEEPEEELEVLEGEEAEAAEGAPDQARPGQEGAEDA